MSAGRSVVAAGSAPGRTGARSSMRSPFRTRQRGQFAGAPKAWILSLQLEHSSWDIGLRKEIALRSRSG
jgi:hypothetical protein